MCGICGFISKENYDEGILKTMNDKLNHRGPNDEGLFFEINNKNYCIGLAHKRLSIMDLSPLGHQPMFSDNGEIVVVFNGEIYNFEEIKSELEKKNYVFKSHSDTEVVVKSYEEWGIDSIKKFNGMFSISIYDKKKDEFYLVRDRMGVKPLYYFYNNKEIVFSSELKSLMINEKIPKKIDLHGLSLFLYHGYITSPFTIFDNIHKLEPGHYIRFKDDKIYKNKYWDVDSIFINSEVIKEDKNEIILELEKVLKKTVESRMLSDVPLGAFLSGGVDSSLIVSVMQSISKEPIKTFTIGFKEEKYNEAIYAKEIAKYLGTEHTELYLSISDCKKYIEEIPKYFDEPFADSSQIPTMMVCELAKKDVTVVMSGDGGDELFCGYERYETNNDMKKYLNLTKVLNKVPFLKRGIKSLNLNSKWTQIFEMTSEGNIINSGYLNFINNFKIVKNYECIPEDRYVKLTNSRETLQEKNMILDMKTYLPDDIMAKVDRASMRVSLEARAPLVDDHLFVEFSAKVPHNMKYNSGEKKYLLKQLLYRYIPKNLVDRPKKGFSIPIIEWLHSDLHFLIEDNLNERFIKEQSIFRWEEIEKLIKKFDKSNVGKKSKSNFINKYRLNKDGLIERTIWHLIVFQLWYKEYLLETSKNDYQHKEEQC